MDLTPFIKKTVTPGEPLTAQAWNDVVEGIDGAYQFLLATQHTVRVQITNPGLDLDQVRVTATRSDAAPVEAVRPVAPGTAHVLSRLEAGAWTITAELPGFQTETTTVTIADSGETAVSMALTQAGGIMPDLFGANLGVARAALAAARIPLVRLLDFSGRDLPPATPGDYENQPVLVQWPAFDAALPPGGGARLVVAVPVETEPAVAIPSLTSLTQAEAQRALESIGLTLGRVSFVSR